jgi:glycosyltransferase involved in cell wall biosynthesis
MSSARAAVTEGLVVSYTGLLGGAGRLLVDLAPALPGDPVLACPPGPLADAARGAGMRVRELAPRRLELRGSVRDRVGAPLRIGAQARELRKLPRPGWTIAWSMRAAMSATLAGLDRGGALLFQHNDLLPRGPAAGAVRVAARRARLVSALSGSIARDLDPRGRLPVEVSHPGVDLERFAARPLPDGPPELLLLGALVPWKRPDFALEVTARVPEARLLVAGAPIDPAGEALVARMRERAARPDLAGRVDFLGWLADPRPALERATVVLHCAPAEPFGIALVEALATGRPVVAPAAAGPLEIVDEECGGLYPPLDAEAAARAVTDVLQRKAGASAAARARAEASFSLDAARARLRAQIERVAAA